MMLEWIVTSSILIAIIIALRYLLKGKISLRLQYALWALVLLRLLLPFSIGSSSLSVMNTAREIPVLQDFESVRDVSEIWRGQNGQVEGYSAYALMPDTPVTVSESKTEAAFARMEKALAFRDIFISVWLLGAAAVFGVFVSSNLRFFYQLHRSRRALEVRGTPLPVYLSHEIDTPCLFGPFSPAIYVTAEAAESETILRHAVAHEATHYRHGDHIWSIGRAVCLALHWYNPLVWWAAFLSRHDGELACDEATIRRIGEAERAEYGRTLITMTCRRPTALLQTATTMTGSRRSITERITLIAKKPKTAVITLVAVLFIAAVTAGCTFTGAKEKQKDFIPDTVNMVQMLSSAYPPEPITDADTVGYLWSLYQGFEFDGTTETLDKENVWSITVAFIDSETDQAEHFTIHQGGLCQLGDDYETYHILVNGADIYKTFFSYFEAARASGSMTQSGADIAVDDSIDAPDAVVDFAKAYVQDNIAYYAQLGANPVDDNMTYSIVDAKITGLTKISTGTAGLSSSINMYLLEYRLKADIPDHVMLAGGMRMEDGWITEWGSTGQPYLLLFCEDSGTERAWQRICVTNTDVILTEYGTPEMLAKYGDAYTAAAMELYQKHLNSGASVAADYATDKLSVNTLPTKNLIRVGTRTRKESSSPPAPRLSIFVI